FKRARCRVNVHYLGDGVRLKILQHGLQHLAVRGEITQQRELGVQRKERGWLNGRPASQILEQMVLGTCLAAQISVQRVQQNHVQATCVLILRGIGEYACAVNSTWARRSSIRALE